MRWKDWTLGFSILLNFVLIYLWLQGLNSGPRGSEDAQSAPLIEVEESNLRPIFEENSEERQSKSSSETSLSEKRRNSQRISLDSKQTENLKMPSNDSLVGRLENAPSEPLETNTINVSQGMLEFQNAKGYTIQYAGSIQNNQANGSGIGVWNTGSYYKGEWKNGMRHGFGNHTWVDGERYEGSYVYDKREGFGTYRWKNGESYSGAWKNDRRHGFGVLKNKKGSIKKEGIWENDEFVKTADE